MEQKEENLKQTLVILNETTQIRMPFSPINNADTFGSGQFQLKN